MSQPTPDPTALVPVDEVEGGFGVSLTAPVLLMGSMATAGWAGIEAAGAFGWSPAASVLLAALVASSGLFTLGWLFTRHSISGRIKHRTRVLRAALKRHALDDRARVGETALRIDLATPLRRVEHTPERVGAAQLLRIELDPPPPDWGFDTEPDDPRHAAAWQTLRRARDEDGAALVDGAFIVPLINKPTSARALGPRADAWLETVRFIEFFADREAAWLVCMAFTETDPRAFGLTLARLADVAEPALVERVATRARADERYSFQIWAAAGLGDIEHLDAMLEAHAPPPDFALEEPLQDAFDRARGHVDLDRWARHARPAVRHAVASLRGLPRRVRLDLLDDAVPAVAARSAAILLSAPAAGDAARRLLARPDRLPAAPEGLSSATRQTLLEQAFTVIGDRGEADDLPTVSRWIADPDIQKAARRARDQLRARHAATTDRGDLSLVGPDLSGGLSTAGDDPDLAGGLTEADDARG